MSRLDSFIRRMSAQRDILNDLSIKLERIPGPIFEFGFGGGRTYDHLCERFPKREIVVFEWTLGESRLSRPMPRNLVVGDIRETSSGFPTGCAALIHSDINSGIAEYDAELKAWLPAVIARLLRPGGFAASGSDIGHPGLVPLSLPPTIDNGRYHVARRL